MFARTENLLLRPGWSEDAPALAAMMGDELMVSGLCWGRWPVDADHVERWLRGMRESVLPRLLIFSRTEDAPELVGGTGLHRLADGSVEIDMWISPDRRGRGFATEAGRAMLGMAQALGLRQLTACVFNENGAAGRVLAKLGFKALEPMVRPAVLMPAMRFFRSLDCRHVSGAPLLAA